MTVDKAVVCTTGWRGPKEDFSESNLRKLLERNPTFVTQILEESADSAAFTKGRRQVGMAQGPLTWPQIEAFFRLIRVIAEEWELLALELLDNAWLESAAEERSKQKQVVL